MNTPLMPCCYYPTTLVLVDDFYKFLKNFQLSLSAKYLCESFQKPEEALRVLLAKKCLNPIALRWVAASENDENDLDQAGQKTLAIDFTAIRRQIYNPRRFHETTTILIDYAMPSMDGIEFCRKLNNSSLKKIMVTGEADYALAVNAFNEGIIDKFIHKNDEKFFYHITEAIEDLTQKYFLQVSEPISKNLLFSKQFSGNDETVKKTFKNICRENNTIEYYLVDDFGSYLMLDKEGDLTWFIIKPEREMQKFLDIAYGNNAPSEIIHDLLTRQKIPFFLTEENESAPVSRWHDYLHPAKSLVGEDCKYYYATISASDVYNIDKNAIGSYQNYLSSLEN